MPLKSKLAHSEDDSVSSISAGLPIGLHGVQNPSADPSIICWLNIYNYIYRYEEFLTTYLVHI